MSAKICLNFCLNTRDFFFALRASVGRLDACASVRQGIFFLRDLTFCTHSCSLRVIVLRLLDDAAPLAHVHLGEDGAKAGADGLHGRVDQAVPNL